MTVECFKKVMGKTPDICVKSACTDGFYLYHPGNIPTVFFGLGNENLSHGVDEFVVLDDITSSTKIYMEMIDHLLGD